MKKTVLSAVRLLKIQWHESKSAFFFAMLVAVLGGVTPSLEAYSLKKIIDICMAQAATGAPLAESLYRVLPWILAMTVVTTLLIVANILSNKVDEVCGQMISQNLRTRLFDKMRRVDLSIFDQPKYLDLYQQAVGQINGSATIILSNLILLIRQVILFVSFAAVIVVFRWWLLFVILILSVPALIISIKREDRFYQIAMGRTSLRRRMDYYANVLQQPGEQKELRIYASHELFHKKYRQAYAGFLSSIRGALRYDAKGSIAKALLDKLGNAAAYIVLCVDLLSGRLAVGDFTLMITAVGTIQQAAENIYSYLAGIYGVVLFFDVYDRFMNDTPDMADRKALPMPRSGPRTLSFRNVSFRYPNMKDDVLKNVSFDLRFGETVAIVGANGAGKTTIVRLILRLYEPDQGTILLDGTDIRDIAYEDYCRSIATVFQDFSKYSVSLYESVAMKEFDGESESRFEAALAEGGLDAFFEQHNGDISLPLTRNFDENGVQPSIGQWQKIALARAFYKKPDFIVLDEPSSALDPASECELYRSIFEMKRERSVIFVSHRLISTIFADQILFVKNGEICERGTHDELMRKNGAYAEMFSAVEKLYSLRSRVENLEALVGEARGK